MGAAGLGTSGGQAPGIGLHYGVKQESSRPRRTDVCNAVQMAHEEFASL
jgi:hypothetical protein